LGNKLKDIMKKTFILTITLHFIGLASLFASENLDAAKRLVERILPNQYKKIEVKYISSQNGLDVFEIESSRNGKIILSGNNGVSIASALNYYLKNYCNFEITWNGRSPLPEILPKVDKKVRVESPHQLRYYLNYCTFSYSMAWWDWDRWEREIDWMALNGINMPLAITGQEAIWEKVYKDMGLTDNDLNGFFTGPAYFAWFYMNNMDRWGGPLPKTWIESHKVLQKKILDRQRELGMTPVLPAFTGHVPKALKDKYPTAQIDSVNWQGNFPNIFMLNPNDPLFSRIGEIFLKEQTKEYSTDHYYSSDIFNELNPPSSDTKYLSQISEKVFSTLKSVDPDAIWVMQGWLFVSKHGKIFWTPERMKAFLDPVPDDEMVILDLYTENRPRWIDTNGFYGKKWIWNMLHNFGGNIGLFGKAQLIAGEPARVLQDPAKGKYSGIGLTMEAIEQNPMIYQLMLDHTWSSTPINLDVWIRKYIERRYGRADNNAEKAWSILLNTVYKDNKKEEGAPESILTGRPTFSYDSDWTWTDLYYDNREFVKAWDFLIKASPELRNSDGFQYDIVDVSRQAMVNYATALQRELAHIYYAGDLDLYEQKSKLFLELLSDIDQLLATRKDFLLGVWINDARKWGTNKEEADLYERNARNLVTIWGHKDITINDYSARQWSGLVEHYYKKRWEIFFEQTADFLRRGIVWNQGKFVEKMKAWEWNWVNKTDHQLYPIQPQGDPVEIATTMYHKYYKTLSNVNIVNYSNK